MILGAAAAIPVRIDYCYLVYNRVFWARWDGYRAGPLYVTFVNTGTSELRTIRLRIAMPEHVFEIEDRGRFAPNVTITHTFSELNTDLHGWEPRPQPRCSVSAVSVSDASAPGNRKT